MSPPAAALSRCGRAADRQFRSARPASPAKYRSAACRPILPPQAITMLLEVPPAPARESGAPLGRPATTPGTAASVVAAAGSEVVASAAAMGVAAAGAGRIWQRRRPYRPLGPPVGRLCGSRQRVHSRRPSHRPSGHQRASQLWLRHRRGPCRYCHASCLALRSCPHRSHPPAPAPSPRSMMVVVRGTRGQS
jgi:hypothetical protein